MNGGGLLCGDTMLTDEEYNLIIESLRYSKRAFENYKDYPSYEFKAKHIKEVQDLIDKLIQMRRGAK